MDGIDELIVDEIYVDVGIVFQRERTQKRTDGGGRYLSLLKRGLSDLNRSWSIHIDSLGLDIAQGTEMEFRSGPVSFFFCVCTGAETLILKKNHRS